MRQTPDLLWAVLAIGLMACKEPKTPAPPPPTGDDCKAAEANLQQLSNTQGCKDPLGNPLGAPNKLGESYALICERVEREGKVSMRSACVAAAKSCKEVDTCQSQ